jgi:hypothetical protein
VKKLALSSLLLVLLGGCNTIASYVPSLEYCDKVTYSRDGNNAHIEADCHVPHG